MRDGASREEERHEEPEAGYEPAPIKRRSDDCLATFGIDKDDCAALGSIGTNEVVPVGVVRRDDRGARGNPIRRRRIRIERFKEELPSLLVCSSSWPLYRRHDSIIAPALSLTC